MALTNLNKEQLEAVHSPHISNLVIASAGTGKTSTIVGRISFLLNNNIPPEKILLLTFTNKAANEMINRVAKYFNKEIANKIVSGTFHSVSYKLLKRANKNIILKQPSELKTLLKSIYDKNQFMGNDIKPYDSSYLYDLFSLYINTTYGDIEFDEWIARYNEEQEVYGSFYKRVFDTFDKLKKNYNYVSYDDLLVYMINELKDLDLKFHEILVDEYQDTNPLQNLLLESFERKILFCVGDFDQSIYGFNGSDIRIISTFTRRYKKNSWVYTLSKNYRSTKPILDLANRVISNNPRIYPKKLEVTRKTFFHKPQLLIFDELYEQYEHIAKKIAVSTTPKNDIAVIFRNNSSADGIEAHLRELGIECKRKGGVSFFDSKEIKIAIDILSIYENRNDLMSFVHIFEYGKQIGEVFAKDLFEKLMLLGDGDIVKAIVEPNKDIEIFKKQESIVQLSLFGEDSIGNITKFKNLNFDDKFLENPILKHPKLTTESANFLYMFYKFLLSVKNIFIPKTFIQRLKNSEFFKYILDILATNRAKQKDGSINQSYKEDILIKIEKKMQTLIDLSKKHNSIKHFLNTIVLVGNETTNKHGVNLLTIHASKGLEFDEVYIVDLAQGRFPNTKLINKNGGTIEEERRLFYVAVTRAKDMLYLSYAKYDKIRKIDFKPSQFLVEAKLLSKIGDF